MPSLNTPLTLPCGAVLKNRIVKSAMSDSLGDGKGNPTESQIRLYEKWQQAKSICTVPLMVTGGIKKVELAVHAIESGSVDIVGSGRAFILDPALASNWLKDSPVDPIFPRFDENPEGGITAWYTMRITAIGEDRDAEFSMDLPDALSTYEERDAQKSLLWSAFFSEQ